MDAKSRDKISVWDELGWERVAYTRSCHVTIRVFLYCYSRMTNLSFVVTYTADFKICGVFLLNKCCWESIMLSHGFIWQWYVQLTYYIFKILTFYWQKGVGRTTPPKTWKKGKQWYNAVTVQKVKHIVILILGHITLPPENKSSFLFKNVLYSFLLWTAPCLCPTEACLSEINKKLDDLVILICSHLNNEQCVFMHVPHATIKKN